MGDTKLRSIGRVLILLAAGLSIAIPASALAMTEGRIPQPTASPSSLPSPSSSSGTSSVGLDAHHYRAVVFGGSCEEGSTTNDFHDSFVTISAALNGAGWDVRPLFAGDSAHCSVASTDPSCQGSSPAANCCPAGLDLTEWSVTAIAQAAGKDPSTVGRASKGALIQSLQQAATELSPGDELLLVIDTHGYGEQAKGQTYWDHGICVSSDRPHGTVANFDPASNQMNAANKEGLMYMSDPDLQASLKKLQSAGVKMGFLDDSCYGGGSIPQLAAYGCTMASTTSQLVNFENDDTSSGGESSNGISYNLPDLLQTDANTLTSQSFNPKKITPKKITMEELWFRVLSRSKIAGIPEFSGFMSDAATAESLGNWMNSIIGDVAYRRGNTPFTPNPGKDVLTPAPLVDYAQTYLTAVTDPTVQASDAGLVLSCWQSPGFPGSYDGVNSKALSALQAQIAQLPADWTSWVSQFNALTTQETAILSDLATLNIDVQWSFTGTLQGTSDLLNDVFPTISQQGIFTYKVSANGNPWIEVGDNFVTPDSDDFASSTQVAANTIAYFMDSYKLSHDGYITGLGDNFGDSLGAMIVQEETQAWSLASPVVQNQMKNDFQQLKTLRTEESALFNQLTVDTTSYLAQARMYAYLEYRKQAATTDTMFSQCSDFVLKQY